ncbi:uncharacterized protein CYBJADRAFT_169518 [Cyberlindnera jadinii NRRL Y-1542]|uniref:Secreted protein n=1 Tax=Cyberlindnera jadinii (strain ATCC 18201 / CBS 1600 / BCRC 20928 / JCM 3617 / NBRC 0987 / NRRL Y-1542) TaxID=983966 RepID=A0A1E4RVJ3_CYBJN|nr:hypothetical protein CYBJADRAFT_169518 [Cyberlindnera jadinii NRRL Y-1542]ODV71294.1 hypothetical protein CYBJADRAFT_169518 [Cyberlindnera jadinii NRRL Y-1542]
MSSVSRCWLWLVGVGVLAPSPSERVLSRYSSSATPSLHCSARCGRVCPEGTSPVTANQLFVYIPAYLAHA